MVERVDICVKDGKGFDVISFAGARRIQGARFGKQLRAALEIALGRAPPKLVIQAHGLTPVRHGTVRVFLLDFFKLIAGLLVFERIQESYAALKLRLRAGSTRDREGHAAEFFGGIVVVRLILSEAR